MFSLRYLRFVLCSRDLDVLRAQRNIGFFILITHKSVRKSDPIAIMWLDPCSTWFSTHAAINDVSLLPFNIIDRFHVTSLPPCWWTITKDSSLASIVRSSSMAATSLPFDSLGIDCKPSIQYYTLLFDYITCWNPWLIGNFLGCFTKPTFLSQLIRENCR